MDTLFWFHLENKSQWVRDRIFEETHLTTARSISRILDPTPAFDRASIPFFKWIANYYLSGLGEVIATALPRDYKGKSLRVYTATEAGVGALAEDSLRSANQTSVLREIIAKPNRSSKGLSRSIDHLDHAQVTRLLDALCKKEFIRFEDKVNNGPKSKIKIAVLESPRVRVSQCQWGPFNCRYQCYSRCRRRD